MNRDASNRPTLYTAQDRARMAAALARSDREAAAAIRTARLYRLAYVAATIAVGLAFFYGVTN